MIMLKFSTQAKTILGCWVHLPSGRFKYDLAMLLFFQQLEVSQSFSYPCTISFLVDQQGF